MLCEICVDSVDGARAAKAAGAARVELCASLLEGGITPSRGMIRAARAVPGIRLHVIIRPRGGDFLFSDDEFAAMAADIETAKAEGADGVVIGQLTAEGLVDAARTRELIALARPMAVTFHRAFDMTPEPYAALETLVDLGVDRILTSGQEASVLEGLPLIAELVKRAGERVIIMPSTDRPIRKQGHAEEIAGGSLIVHVRGLLAQSRPVAGGAVVAPQPCQGHKVNLLVHREGLDEGDEFFNHWIIRMVFEDGGVLVI